MDEVMQETGKEVLGATAKAVLTSAAGVAVAYVAGNALMWVAKKAHKGLSSFIGNKDSEVAPAAVSATAATVEVAEEVVVKPSKK